MSLETPKPRDESKPACFWPCFFRIFSRAGDVSQLRKRIPHPNHRVAKKLWQNIAAVEGMQKMYDLVGGLFRWGTVLVEQVELGRIEKHGWSVDSSFSNRPCAGEAENISKMWNFFKLHDSAKISNLSIWKTRKRHISNKFPSHRISTICVWHPQTFLTSLTTYYAGRHRWGFDAWSAHCVGNSGGFDMKSPKQPTFFDEFPLRLLFFRFRFEPHPTPFFATFFFFFGKFVDLWGEDGWEPRSSFSFFVDADAKTWGIPQEAGRGSICWLAYVTSALIFFGRDPPMKKTPIDSKFKMLKFFDSKMLILFVWFFLVVESCTSKPSSYWSSQEILWEEMVFWGRHPRMPEASFKRLRERFPTVHWFSQSFTS